MPLKIDIRKDPFFAKGLSEGEAKGKAEGIEERSNLFVVNLLKNTDFNDEKIAMLAAVDLEFVRKARKEVG